VGRLPLGLLVAATLAIVPGPVAADVLVRLAATATVEHEDVVLGDVATVRGAEPLASRARALRLGPAPAVGAAFRLDADGVRRRLRRAQLDPARFRIEGAERAIVTRAWQVVPGPALVDAIRRQVVGRQAGPDRSAAESLTVSAVIPPEDLRVPTGRVALHARVQDAAPGSAFVAATVSVAVDGREVQVVPLTVRVGRLRPVVVATTALAPRDALSATTVRVESRPSTEVPADALTEVSGDLEVITPAAPGDVLTARAVRPRLLIRRGELVTLLVEGRAFVITAQGRAADDARRGDSVRVVNPVSRREVLGIAQAPGVVRVPFHATTSAR
jgi:flagella basal body P-ring formation protein FlgA